ncbi:hypothetical protein SADUNF_Sadunf19G0025800 [Salix dunnii]|uniref:Uncharacterized protein n=1 Tax=Salix dunnii TaxID=1413687 RepID=A0A835J0S3_9ROSI|nr:hypothetical protein SADUNF_Sadunf19G0024800 [Salix dunnii]KAF9661026.1 hypothetical protein SADUNF_Sadunf19G0025200 [Salix dunnii]KAF9661032.1 hypothetical protein SADUNF_Sadunf19G0025800 [Salix dunnii]
MTKTKCSSCLQIARAFGATATINSKTEDPIERIKVCSLSFRNNWRKRCGHCCGSLGQTTDIFTVHTVMIGLAQAGAIGEIDINRLVRRAEEAYQIPTV